jgi:hypothetical protein
MLHRNDVHLRGLLNLHEAQVMGEYVVPDVIRDDESNRPLSIAAILSSWHARG